MLPSRILYIDESLSKRLCVLLRQRGRAAKSASELGLLTLKDEPVLREVYKDREDMVFVTADDSLPAEHSGVIREVKATVATIAPWVPGRWRSYQRGLSAEEAYKREVVSRWAHAMQEQRRGTSRRYSLSGGRRWTPKRRMYM